MITQTGSQAFQEAANYFTLVELAKQSEKMLANYRALLLTGTHREEASP